MRIRSCCRVSLAVALSAALLQSGPATSQVSPAGPASGRTDAPAPAGPYDCLIEPSAIVELSAAIVGVVQDIHVDRGDRVTRNQLVARLHDSLERAQLTVADSRAQAEASVSLKRSRLEFEERRLARNARLIDDKIITEKEADEIATARQIAHWEYQEALEQARLARLQRDQAAAELALREVRSPVDGVVIERTRDQGESTGGTPILRIAQIDPLYVEVFVPAPLVSRLRRGQVVSVRSEALQERSLAARIDVIDPVADAASGMTRVRAIVANPDFSIVSGLRCTADLIEPG